MRRRSLGEVTHLSAHSRKRQSQAPTGPWDLRAPAAPALRNCLLWAYSPSPVPGRPSINSLLITCSATSALVFCAQSPAQGLGYNRLAGKRPAPAREGLPDLQPDGDPLLLSQPQQLRALRTPFVSDRHSRLSPLGAVGCGRTGPRHSASHPCSDLTACGSRPPSRATRPLRPDLPFSPLLSFHKQPEEATPPF